MTGHGLGDEDLRSIFQDGPRRRHPDELCPEPEDLWAAARGEVEASVRRRLIDHTGDCPSCAEDWRLARDLVRQVPESAKPFRAPRWLAAAALLVVALGATWILWPGDGGRPPVLREGPESVIEASTSEDRPMSRDAAVLRWQGPDGAEYRLLVTTEELDVLVREPRLKATEYRLPEDVLEGLPADTLLLWQLEATLPDGSKVPSMTFRARLR